MSQSITPTEHRASDAAVIELLRVEHRLGIGELATRLGVTATAVRLRLDRLMRSGLISRTTLAGGGKPGLVSDSTRATRLRGRPSHVYSLTEKGRRTGGDNFRDLALVLWREIRSVREPAIRQGLISRIGSAMAGLYRDEVSGETPRQRLESTAKILQERQISCAVEPSAGPSHQGLAVLTSHACPYPELAEQDRGICAAERLMLQDLVGAAVHLSECRLDGSPCCRFTLGRDDGALPDEDRALQVAGATCIKPV
jgi:DeoR family suf operon transcriptional repressor